MSNIKDFWKNLTPSGKKKLIWMALVVCFVVLTAAAYFLSGRGKTTQTTVIKQERVSIQDKKILEVSEKANYQAIIEQQRILMDKLRNGEITKEQFDTEIAKLTGLPQNKDNQKTNATTNLSLPQDKNISQEPLLPGGGKDNPKTLQVVSNTLPAKEPVTKTPATSAKKIKNKNEQSAQRIIDDVPEGGKSPSTLTPPPPPPSAPLPRETDNLPSNLPEGRRVQIEYLGDIGVVSASAKEKKEGEKDSKKKANIYLPSSFMEATLLSGLDAPTVESAKGNPMLTLLRIKDLAILPNKVKANLKGCFAVAEGYGSLSDERAHLRLVSISCIDKKGQSIIDQKIKGYVVDSDGKVGLRGKVVAKMGAMIARSFIAGFLGGFGDAVRASGTTNMISPVGTTSTINTDQALKAGMGAGIAQSATELQRFYMELARQTMPVIEIGATRSVTLVISEGVTLELKNINLEKEM